MAPHVDYSSPWSLSFPNKINFHYRNNFFFDLEIESKNKKIVKAIISNDYISNNDVPLCELKEFGEEVRIYFDSDKKYDCTYGELSDLKNKEIEKFKTDRTLNFLQDDEIAQSKCSFGFDVPIDYKNEEIILVGMNIEFFYDDGQTEKVNVKLGGKKNQLITK